MPPCTSALVGLSGGLDSIVLLHGLQLLQQQGELPFTPRAIHINHGLHPNAAQWAQYCEAICQGWNVPFSTSELDLLTRLSATGDKAITGIEKTARDGRYTVFAAHLAPGEALLLAHHRDDQMETMLLRLLRGAGPKGLAGIPRTRALGEGFLWRPLLEVDRAALLAYAKAHSLRWIDDESNADQQFDRNYLRHAVLPLLETRWPGYRESWSKSAALLGEAAELLEALAESDLQRLRMDVANELPIAGITALSPARRRNLLRHWLLTLNMPEPSWNTLQQLSETLVGGTNGEGNPDSDTNANSDDSVDANSVYEIGGYTFARYRDRLVVLRQLEATDLSVVLEWDPGTQPTIELSGNGSLSIRPSKMTDTDARMSIILQGPVQIKYRQGGETCSLRGRPRKSLKKILQEQGIAPWCRERLPLLYQGDALIYIPGIGAAESADAPDSGTPCVIDWQSPDWMPGAH